MPDGFQMFTYKPQGLQEPLVKLADVIPPVPDKPKDPGPAVEPEPIDDPPVIWKYKKQTPVEKIEEDRELDKTPSFDFSEKISVEGKERKVELSASGLYVFDKREKFEQPAPPPPPGPTGMWIGVKKPFSDGKVIIPVASKPSDFKTVKVRGQTIKGILNLTKKR